MERIVTAIESGRCVFAVASSLLRDAEVMLALTERSSLPAVALAGPAIPPVMPLGADAMVRAIAQDGGVVVLVDPQSPDLTGVRKLTDLLKKGPHKPAIGVVSKSFNPFAFGNTLQGFEVFHVKGRGQLFFRDLPKPPSAKDVPVPDLPDTRAPKAKAASDAPRIAFVGRDEEVAALGEMLKTGGPIVLSGPPGIGKTWLAVHAIAAAGLQAYPDLSLGHGVGADALAARMAAIAKDGGSEILDGILRGNASTPPEIVKGMIEALQAATGNEDKVLVIHHLEWALGRQGDFFRKSRLEMLIEALLSNAYPLRIVFLSSMKPTFYRTSKKQAVRQIELGGLKGRFLHEIFDVYRAPEFAREKIGPFSERIHGHPLAARTCAVALRDRKEGVALLDDEKFLAAEDPGDTRALKKAIAKQLETVQGPLRDALSVAAHFPLPVPGSLLSEAGLFRKHRSELLSMGLMDVIGTETSEKRYRVHPLVRSQLTLREISSFDTLREIAKHYAERANATTGVERVAIVQATNCCAEMAREPRARIPAEMPDNDGYIESIASILRRKEPRFDLVEKDARALAERQPSNAEAHLLLIEALRRGGARNEDVAAAIDTAVEKAPVPEVFHQAATFYVQRRARPRAIQVLERGIALLPDESRLLTRYAALLLRQGRRPEAMDLLRKVMEMDPELPDAYGLMGMARRDEGAEAMEVAEQLLREAVRLAPEDPVQVSRLVGLLLDKAQVVEFEERDALRREVHELLEPIVKGDQKAPEAFLQLASLLREEGEDLDRVEWLLKKVRKETERGNERRLRVDLEWALLELARGNLDASEKLVRDLAERDPSNHAVFAALAQILMARGLYIPAHAEYMRARERTPAGSLARQAYETEIIRLQALIEAQAAGLAKPPTPAEEEASAEAIRLHNASINRVIRRRGTSAEAPEGEPGEDEALAPEEPASETSMQGLDDEPSDVASWPSEDLAHDEEAAAEADATSSGDEADTTDGGGEED